LQADGYRYALVACAEGFAVIREGGLAGTYAAFGPVSGRDPLVRRVISLQSALKRRQERARPEIEMHAADDLVANG